MRVTHWLTFIAFVALFISGSLIVISHPRFYWGEVGNVNTKPLFVIPIPSSRDTVPNGYNYEMPDENGDVYKRQVWGHHYAPFHLTLQVIVFTIRYAQRPREGERAGG